MPVLLFSIYGVTWILMEINRKLWAFAVIILQLHINSMPQKWRLSTIRLDVEIENE